MNTPKEKSKIQWLKDGFTMLKSFMQEELWIKDISRLSALKRTLFAVCRVVMIVAKGFQQDNCMLQASALTYITLVSLVPMLAIMFSFSKGLGMQNLLLDSVGLERYEVVESANERHWEYKLKEYNQPQTETQEDAAPVIVSNDQGLAQKLPPPMQEAIIRIFQYVENTSFAALGLIGSVMLLFSVIGSMAKLENSFNQIWGVKKPRTYLRKCSEYLVVLLLVPIVFLVATSMNTLLLSNKYVAFLQRNYGTIASLIQTIVRLLGYLFILCAFGFFYMFMPNTRVKPAPALISGISVGLIWFGVQWTYFHLQVGLTKYNSIYGTFAVVPFFLAWLYANWSIILFGAELCFALQNHRTIQMEKASENAPTGVCIVLGQLILFETCKAFHQGKGPWSPVDFGLEQGIPTRFIRHVVDVLAKAGILVKTSQDNSTQDTYLPGKDIAELSPADVEEAFRGAQSLDTKMYVSQLPALLRDKYDQIYQSYASSLASMKFGHLIAQDAAK